MEINKLAVEIKSLMYFINCLENNIVFRKLLFKNSLSSPLKTFIQEWVDFKLGILAEILYKTELKQLIRKEIYSFNRNNIREYLYQNKSESNSIIDSISELINTTNKQFDELDLKKRLKSKLLFHVLNEFILRLSYLYYNFRNHILNSEIDELFERDIEALIVFFSDCENMNNNSSFCKEVKSFCKYLFGNNELLDSREDSVMHFAYKVKYKRNSFF